MKFFLLKNSDLKQETIRIELFLKYFLVILYAVIIIEFLKGESTKWEFVVELIFYLILGRMTLKSLRQLYYSFWTLAMVFAFRVVHGFMDCWRLPNYWPVCFMYITMMAFLGYITYKLLSPVYYPRIRWWIYDFRYRGDLIVQVKNLMSNNVEAVAGRLTDLRRNAGCVLLFRTWDIGDKVLIEAETEFSQMTLPVEIVSRREYSFGRGMSYGVKFLLNSKEEQKTYEEFSAYWRDKKNANLIWED